MWVKNFILSLKKYMLKKITPFFAVSMFSIAWALEIFISKVALLNGIPIFTLLIQSFFVYALFLALWVITRKWRKIRILPKKIFISLFVINSVHSWGAILSIIGVAFTTATNAGFLMKFSLFTTLFFAWLFLKEKLGFSKIFSVILLVIGIFLLSTKGQLITPKLGDIFIILACFCWSIGNVFTKILLQKTSVDSEIIALFRPFSALILFAPLIFFIDFLPSSLSLFLVFSFLDTHSFFYAFFAGFFWSVLTLFLIKTLEISSASYMTMMSMMTPVIVALLAFIFLNERLVFLQYIGAFLIILSGLAIHVFRLDR